MSLSKIVVPLGIVVLAVAATLAPSRALARDLANQANLAAQLAARFDLNEGEVLAFLAEPNPHVVAVAEPEDHLAFINARLTAGVADGSLTRGQKRAIMAKLQDSMDQGPSPAAYRRMSAQERQEQINQWKQSMNQWSSSRGVPLAEIRRLTGKGNKYLMGMEL